ncbi:MAG: DUF1598 domain-containing protein [Planctomycetes bacterium]|nr:DUF1598 domain-containing protein [Planctomycetota bacterium]
MFIHIIRVKRALCAAVALGTALGSWSGAMAGQNFNNFRQGAVGGVTIDANGELTINPPKVSKRVAEIRRKAFGKAPAGLNESIPLRKISLRRLQEALAKHYKQVPLQRLADELRFLGGLQRVKYVLVYPEDNDIVLVGPGEGWKVADDGIVVGVTTGRPVLLLDDLLVALRTAQPARAGALTCSIDPTPEGRERFAAFFSKQRTINNRVIAGAEKAMGPQGITLKGVPQNTHFARVMVTADFQMKRLAMGFEKSPVKGMPEYLSLIKGGKVKNAMPRWWMSTNYKSLLRDKAGLTWQLRGQGVKVLSTDNAPAKKWAENMTAKYDALAEKMPVFAQLRNCMDLAVVGALIFKEDLTGKAGMRLDYLLNERELGYVASLNPPKQVATHVRAVRRSGGWLITASGGVEIMPWSVVAQSEVDSSISSVQKKAANREKVSTWWRN